MTYPSKQNEIRERLLRDFREVFPPGGKIYPERDYAARLGVTRKALRKVLAVLEEEKRIVRGPAGTFLRETGSGEEREPVTMLLPCPDYMDKGTHSSLYALRQILRGVMASARETGTSAVTLPVTETNREDEIRPGYLRNLNRNSMVVIVGDWFRQVFPVLAERGCRTALLSPMAPDGLDLPFPSEDCLALHTPDSLNFLPGAVRALHNAGARKILYFGSSAAQVSVHGRDDFRKELVRRKLPGGPDMFTVYDQNLSLRERLALLRSLRRRTGFDGLILEINPYREHNCVFDLYEEAGLPRSLRLMVTPSDLLLQPKVAQSALVCHLPYMRCGRTMTDFLLSGKRGRTVREVRFLFQPAADFLRETGYGKQR